MSNKIILKIKGMDCSSCVINIDGALEDMNGIAKSRTNYVKSQTEIMFDPSKVTPQKILSLIREVGYDAEFV